jgi:hypothetical protein
VAAQDSCLPVLVSNVTQHNDMQHNWTQIQCCFAKNNRKTHIIMLSVAMLSVAMLNVVGPLECLGHCMRTGPNFALTFIHRGQQLNILQNRNVKTHFEIGCVNSPLLKQ